MMLARISAKISALLRWMFGAPVSELPSAFGDTVPSDLRVFEEQMQHVQDTVQPVQQYQNRRQKQTNPPKRNVPIERL